LTGVYRGGGRSTIGDSNTRTVGLLSKNFSLDRGDERHSSNTFDSSGPSIYLDQSPIYESLAAGPYSTSILVYYVTLVYSDLLYYMTSE